MQGATTAAVGAQALPRRRLVDPGEPRRLLAAHPAVFVAALLAGMWLVLGPRTPDLAAQFYRVDLFAHTGFSVWDNNWYDGHHLLGYSLTYPALANLIGLRLSGALAAVGSTALFERIVVGHYGRGARFGAVWFALGAVGDPIIGRLTFALGVTLALAAVLAVQHRRLLVAAVLAALCAASSPVAGLFLALCGVAYALATRRLRGSLVLAAAPLLVAGVIALLFPEGGVEPYGTGSFVATIGSVAAALVLLPQRERVLRVGAVLYVVAVALSYVLRTPMGSNIERLGILLAGPLLACSWSAVFAGRPRPWAQVPAVAPQLEGGWRALRQLTAEGWAHRPRHVVALLVVAGLGLLSWQVAGPVLQTAAVIGDASTSPQYYRPLIGFLDAQQARSGPFRLEVPFTRSHWDAAYLAPRFALARGWERQLDVKYDALFFQRYIDAETYHEWLVQTGVRFVALPDVPLDPSSNGEAELIRGGLPYLRLVWSSSHWLVYAVRDPLPLAEGPGRLVALDHSGFMLQVDRPGTFLVRVHYTPYWSLTPALGCTAPSQDGWTIVQAPTPGPLRVTASFSLGDAIGGGQACGAAAPSVPGALPAW